MADFTSRSLRAYLSGAWVDLSADWFSKNVHNVEWGINGIEPLDIMPDVGEMRFTLKNIDGKYYPNGASPLAGWGKNVKVQMILTYAALSRVFTYYVSDIQLTVGKTGLPAEDRVQVTALDWVKFAEKFPILAPNIEENKRADEGIQIILNAMTQPPISSDLQAGVNTFPVIFDGVGLRTTAYSEFAKFTNSEYGTLALLKDATNGETLKFFNNTANSSSEVKAFFEGGLSDLKLTYGENVINRAVVTAYPKTIDKELKVLYSLDKPMSIQVGETITLRAEYKNPDGGNKINAIGSSMQAPEMPGAPNPYLMALLNFTTDLTDETGRHTWTSPSALNKIIRNDIYSDGAGTHISGNILGPYAVLGGYSPFKITTPSSTDFEFGAPSEATQFTIGWYENIINPDYTNVAMARDSTQYPPFMLGMPTTAGMPKPHEMVVYFSSNGLSFDIKAFGSLGQVQVGRWVYYEVSRDADGWYYCFADGKLTDKWHSLLAINSSSGAFTIGNVRNTYWSFMGIDSFFIEKGRCKHKSDFERPLRNIGTTLEGDYSINIQEDGTGFDFSSFPGLFNVTAGYGSEAISYILNNAWVYDSWITRLQARGRGVYAYNSIENSATDLVSAAAYDYHEVVLDQKYQTDVKFGSQVVTKIVAQEANPRTRLESISYFANKSAEFMTNFMTLDIHDLIHVKDTPRGVDNFYFIQKVKFIMQAPDIIYVTYSLKSALDVDAAYPPPVPPTFQGVVGTEGIDQLQDMGSMVLTQIYTNALSLTLDGMEQLQDMGTMDLQQVFTGGGLIDARDVAARGVIYYLNDTASDIGGYKTLIKDYTTIVSGTASASVTVGTFGIDSPTALEEFATPALDIPYLFKAPFLPVVWLSSSVSENFNLFFNIYLRTAGGSETSLASCGMLNIALTGSAAKFDPNILLKTVDDTLINSTDRIVIKILAQAYSSTATVTIHYGADANPSLLCVPNYAPASGGGSDTGRGYTIKFEGLFPFMTASTSYWIGSVLSLGYTLSSHYVYLPKAGTLMGMEVYTTVGGTLATGDPTTINLYLNGTIISSNYTPMDTDYVHGGGATDGGYPYPMDVLDELIIEIATPAWSVAPTNVQISVILWIDE